MFPDSDPNRQPENDDPKYFCIKFAAHLFFLIFHGFSSRARDLAWAVPNCAPWAMFSDTVIRHCSYDLPVLTER